MMTIKRARRYETYVMSKIDSEYYYCESREETIITEFHNYTEDRDIMDEREYDCVYGENCRKFTNDSNLSWFDIPERWGFR